MARHYGIRCLGGIVFKEDARRVPLRRFGLHCGERFRYEYDFTADWRLDIRLEKALPFGQDRALPLCIGGSRAAPPENCPGAWDYLERLDRHKYQPPSKNSESWLRQCSDFLIPMATATPLAISMSCAKLSIG
jgi:hypothetical protein